MKKVAPSYSFNASTKTIVLLNESIGQDQLLLVVNATRGVVYYNFASTSPRATVTPGGNNSTTTIVLEAETSGHSNSDNLTIYYDDQSSVQQTNIEAKQAGVGNGGFTTGIGLAFNEYNSDNDPPYVTKLVSDKITSETAPLPVGGSVSVGLSDKIAIYVESDDGTGTFVLRKISDNSWVGGEDDLFYVSRISTGWECGNSGAVRTWATNGTRSLYPPKDGWTLVDAGVFKLLPPVQGILGLVDTNFEALNNDTNPQKAVQIGFKETNGSGDFRIVDNDSSPFPVQGFGKSSTNDGTLYPVPVCESGNNDYLGRHIPIGFKNSNSESTLVASDTPLPIEGTVTANVPALDDIKSDNGSNNASSAINIGFNTQDNEFKQVSDTQPLPISGTVNAYRGQFIRIVTTGEFASNTILERTSKYVWESIREDVEGWRIVFNDDQTRWEAFVSGEGLQATNSNTGSALPPKTGWQVEPDEGISSLVIFYEQPFKTEAAFSIDTLPYIKIEATVDDEYGVNGFLKYAGNNTWTGLGGPVEGGGGLCIWDENEGTWYIRNGSINLYENPIELSGFVPVPPLTGWVLSPGRTSGTLSISYEQPQLLKVSASSLPLPSGAATSANQTTANTSLSNIDTDIGAQADSAASSDTGSFSLISLIKRLLSTKLPNLSNGRVPVDGSGVTQPVSGTFWQATQPVSGTVGISGTVPVSGTFWQATQPVSGTVTAAQTTAANLNATVIGSGSFTAAQATAANLNATVVGSGSFTAAQATAANLNATVVGSGSFTAQQATAANLNATVVQGTATNLKTQAENYQGGSAVGSANPLQVTLANTGANATAVKVDNSGVTQPVSQATAANLNATVVQGTATNLKTQAENYQGGVAVGSGNPLQVTLANTGANATAVKVDNSGVTQPVSGTVTASQATAANLNATVVGSGSFTAAQATAANLNATVVQGTATNLKTQAEVYQGGTAVGSASPLQVTLANTGANATAVKVDNSGINQPVTPRNGAVTVTTGATSGTANTSAQALAQNTNRRYLLIQNISDTDMYFNFGAAATTSSLLIAKSGGGIVFEGGFCPTDAVNVICSAASKSYYILSA